MLDKYQINFLGRGALILVLFFTLINHINLTTVLKRENGQLQRSKQSLLTNLNSENNTSNRSLLSDINTKQDAELIEPILRNDLISINDLKRDTKESEPAKQPDLNRREGSTGLISR